jgi:two-component system chemotaxis response regulator CheB
LHIPVQQDDLLTALIQRKTALAVHTAWDGQEIVPGNVYVAPPDNHLLIEGPRIRISHGPRQNRHRPAIDPLFRSAAKFYGSRVIGVVLTGQLDDGMIGLNAIKTHGGIAIVQSPEDAAEPEMVRNALRNVQVDYSLSLEEIGLRLRELVKPMGSTPSAAATDLSVDPPVGLQKITDALGSPAPYICPECHGPLWENQNGAAIEYRCHVGHSYSPESLLIDQDEDLERALWSAIRTFEEQADLLRRVAKKNITAPLLEKWRVRAEENQKHADAIRSLLQARR